MHESHQVQKLIAEAGAMAASRKVSRPRVVTVRMGELLGFDDVSVGLHWEEMTQGTALEGSVLKIEPVPAKLKCPSCAQVFPKQGSNMSCPKCRVMGTPTPTGKEFSVVDISK
jgi:hydrogenase nickel incorporation protein HypA/HybF